MSLIKTDERHLIKVDRMIVADWKCETESAKHIAKHINSNREKDIDERRAFC